RRVGGGVGPLDRRHLVLCRGDGGRGLVAQWCVGGRDRDRGVVDGDGGVRRRGGGGRRGLARRDGRRRGGRCAVEAVGRGGGGGEVGGGPGRGGRGGRGGHD